jgi:hypothetical protein
MRDVMCLLRKYFFLYLFIICQNSNLRIITNYSAIPVTDFDDQTACADNQMHSPYSSTRTAHDVVMIFLMELLVHHEAEQQKGIT